MQNNQTFELAQKLTSEIVTRHFDTSGLSEDAVVLFKRVIELRFNRRWWLLTEKEDYADLWSSIRSNEQFCEMVLLMTFELKARLTNNDPEWDVFVKHLANASTTCTRMSTRDGNVIDEDLLHRLPTESEMYEALLSNPWCVLVVMLSFSDLPFIREVSQSLGDAGK